MLMTVTTKITDQITMYNCRINGNFTQDTRYYSRYGYELLRLIDGNLYLYWYPSGIRNPGSYDVNTQPPGIYPGREYSVRWKVQWDANILYGNWLNFTTTIPIVTTDIATEVKVNGANMHGHTTTDARGYNAFGFEWKKGIGGTIYSYWWPIGTYNAGVYYWNRVLTGLIANSQYYFRHGDRVATGDKFYGEWLGFFTGSQEYEYRAFGMDFEGVVKYGKWKPYSRPIS